MIDKINTNPIQDPLEKPPTRQQTPPKTVQNSDADVSLQVNYAPFINQATQISPDDPTALEQARELLLSDQLETTQNIREAAENILKFGI